MAVDPDDAPTPGLADRFTLLVELGPGLTVGMLATGGVREHRPAEGGAFEGGGIRGEVVGGGETLLHRPDGVGVVEASFLIRSEDAAIIRLIGTGYLTTDGAFAGTRMSIVFEVDEDGPHAALSTRAYVAERAAGSDRYLIAEVL